MILPKNSKPNIFCMKSKKLIIIGLIFMALGSMTACQQDQFDRWAGYYYPSEDIEDDLKKRKIGLFQSEAECIEWGEIQISQAEDSTARYHCLPDLPPAIN